MAKKVGWQGKVGVGKQGDKGGVNSKSIGQREARPIAQQHHMVQPTHKIRLD